MKANEHDRQTAVYLLNLANDMRRLKNDALLDDLPESVVQDSHRCIIANAFNYGCTVDPQSEITFQTEEDRDNYMRVMNLNPAEFNFSDDLAPYNDGYGEDDHIWDNEAVYSSYPGAYEAPLTNELVDIAESFDAGTLFTEYSEY